MSNETPKNKIYYLVKGLQKDSDGDYEIGERNFYRHFSPADVEYIQRRSVELAREIGLESTTFKEVVEDTVSLTDLQGIDEKFDDLLFNQYPSDFCLMDITDIDFEHPVFFDATEDSTAINTPSDK